MRTMRVIPMILLLVAGSVGLASAQGPGSTYSHSLAPYVPSPEPIVDRMLEIANLKPGEVLYDLGCGDGRVLIAAVQKYHAKAVGVELNPKIYKRAQDRINLLGLQNHIQLIHGDLLDVDLSDADVVTLYLMRSSNEGLRPRLEKFLRPGARVVAHDYPVPGWKPNRVEEAETDSHVHTVYLYVMPPVKMQAR